MYSRACIDILLLQSSDNSLIVDIKLFYFERLTVLTHFIKIIRGYLCIIQSDTPTIFYHILWSFPMSDYSRPRPTEHLLIQIRCHRSDFQGIFCFHTKFYLNSFNRFDVPN